MTQREKKDSVIAAALTMALALALLLALWFGSVTFDRAGLAASSVPEIAPEEETFLEPELLPENGDAEEEAFDEEAPQAQGMPEKSETENPQKIVKDENPKPAPPIEKLVTTKKESPVQATTPTKREQEAQKATSAVANKFAPRNGMAEGKFDASSTAAAGVAVSGKVSGRAFLGCPKPDVELRAKVVIRVELTVNAEGKVTEIRGASGISGSPSAAIIAKCKTAAKGATWAAKAGAAPAPGSITFTITPRI